MEAAVALKGWMVAANRGNDVRQETEDIYYNKCHFNECTINFATYMQAGISKLQKYDS